MKNVPSHSSRAALDRVLQAPDPEGHPVFAGSVRAEIVDLIQLCRFAEIEYVDAELRRTGETLRRRTLHDALSARREDPEIMALLKRLAARDKNALELAPYREGGLTHLLEVLEDEHASISARMTSARLLGQFGGPQEVRRMEAFSARLDERALETPNQPVPPETLGAVVRNSMRSIGERSGDP